MALFCSKSIMTWPVNSHLRFGCAGLGAATKSFDQINMQMPDLTCRERGFGILRADMPQVHGFCWSYSCNNRDPQSLTYPSLITHHRTQAEPASGPASTISRSRPRRLGATSGPLKNEDGAGEQTESK